MTNQTWIFAGVLSLAAAIGLFVVSSRVHQSELEAANARAASARSQIEHAQSAVTDLQAELARARGRVSQLEQEKEQISRAQQTLESEMRGALESKEVTISQLKGKLTVSILDRVMFDSGEASLKPDGEQVLLKIADVLSKFPNRQVHVIGHTDNVPIRATMFSRFSSNWELSTARATTAVRYLVEKAGVDPRRLGAVGYGEFHPIAENSTAEGRARNRRIAVVVLPEELSETFTPGDVIQPPPGLVATNAPPATAESALPAPAADPGTNNPPASEPKPGDVEPRP